MGVRISLIEPFNDSQQFWYRRVLLRYCKRCSFTLHISDLFVLKSINCFDCSLAEEICAFPLNQLNCFEGKGLHAALWRGEGLKGEREVLLLFSSYCCLCLFPHMYCLHETPLPGFPPLSIPALEQYNKTRTPPL